MANGNWSGSKWIRPERRLAIHLRDRLCCQYCGIGIEDDAMLTLDHLIPRSKGGSNQSQNLITACKRCNSSRGNRPLTAFCQAVADYIGQDATSIHRRIQSARKRKLPMAMAKRILDDRRKS